MHPVNLEARLVPMVTWSRMRPAAFSGSPRKKGIIWCGYSDSARLGWQKKSAFSVSLSAYVIFTHTSALVQVRRDGISTSRCLKFNITHFPELFERFYDRKAC